MRRSSPAPSVLVDSIIIIIIIIIITIIIIIITIITTITTTRRTRIDVVVRLKDWMYQVDGCSLALALSNGLAVAAQGPRLTLLPVVVPSPCPALCLLLRQNYGPPVGWGHPAFRAIALGDQEALEAALEGRGSGAPRDDAGRTLLMWAAVHGNLKMAAWLVERDGGLVKEVDRKGRTAVMHAAATARVGMVQWLVQEGGGGASVNAQDSEVQSRSLIPAQGCIQNRVIQVPE
jgi:hypothetical protein